MTYLDITSEPRHLDEVAGRLLLITGVVAVVGLGGAAALAMAGGGGVDRLLGTYLVSFTFYLSLSLGALFFVLLQHLTRAGWSVVVRRLAEGLATNVWLVALLGVPVVLGMGRLYHWTHPEGDPLIMSKSAFLNPGFFTVRLIFYFVVWGGLALLMWRGSVAQDASGDPRLTRRLERLSAPGMVLFALTINFAAFDLLMSLDPHWFSTIFGVYYFSSSVVCFFAAMPILLYGLQRAGYLRRVVTAEHYHDLGKLLYAFIVFWAYIAFSQYMLIWYGNLPEETGWFLKRQTGDWLAVSIVLIVGHFVIPFLALISRYPKRRPALLVAAASWMLVMHWVDLYWLAMPELSPDKAPLGPIDALCFLGLGGLFSLGLVLWLRRHSLVPEKDPRLDESLAFENA